MRLLASLLVLLWASAIAHAAGTATPVAIVVTSCNTAGIFGPAGNSAPLTVDTAGNLCSSGGGSGGGGTSSNFDATFPTAGTAAGMKSGSNMVPLTSTDGTSLDVNCITGCSGGGGGGTSSNFGSAFPTAGTAAGASNGTNMVPLLVDGSGFLKVILQTGANVIGAVTQSGTWNIGTVTTITNAVTVAQSTASNLLAQVSNNGTFAVQAAQSGSWTATVTQGTASNLKAQVVGAGAAGTADTGVVTIQGISGMTAVKVDGTGGSFPVSGTVAVTQSTSPWIMAGGGTAGSAASGVVTIQGIASMTPVQVSQATASNLNAQVVGTGSAGSPASGVVTIQGIPSGSPVAGNVTFLGSAAINLGAGNASTGTQRVLLATDQVALASWGLGATAAAVPSGAQYVGGNKSGNLTGFVMGSSNDLTVGGAGTAGSAAGGVLTVQGATSMTPVLGKVAPSSASADGIVSTATSALASNLVLKSGAGNLYGFVVTSSTGTPGYVMVFNATSAPADGAVTPVKCYYLPANSSIGVDFRPGPMPYFSTGITAVFSSTGCFTKTASATAFISGEAQ